MKDAKDMKDPKDAEDTSSILNSQSPIRNPQSPTLNPQSAIPNPQSPIRNPQSPIRNHHRARLSKLFMSSLPRPDSGGSDVKPSGPFEKIWTVEGLK